MTIPTVGMDIAHIKKGIARFTSIDLSGSGTSRYLWSDYYNFTLSALVIVIDTGGNYSSDRIDRKRLSIVGDELQTLISSAPDVKCPVLIYANKTDLPNRLYDISMSNH
jgi:hypothetical protein